MIYSGSSEQRLSLSVVMAACGPLLPSCLELSKWHLLTGCGAAAPDESKCRSKVQYLSSFHLATTSQTYCNPPYTAAEYTHTYLYNAAKTVPRLAALRLKIAIPAGSKTLYSFFCSLRQRHGRRMGHRCATAKTLHAPPLPAEAVGGWPSA